MCFIKRYVKPGCYKNLHNWNKVVKLKTIVCTACHKYRSNSSGFLDSRDMVQTFNIRKFFTKNNCFNNLFALNKFGISISYTKCFLRFFKNGIFY